MLSLVFIIESVGRERRPQHHDPLYDPVSDLYSPRLCQSPFLLADIQCAVSARPLSESEYHHSKCYKQLQAGPPPIVSHRSDLSYEN